MRVYITKEQAAYILHDKDDIHTFYNPGFGLVGADWSKREVLSKINGSEILELTGPSARGVGHGLVAYNDNVTTQGDLLFIETDEEKLCALEAELGKEQEHEKNRFN